jgi:hypothetical protein
LSVIKKSNEEKKYLLLPEGKASILINQIKEFKIPFFSRLINLCSKYTKQQVPEEHPSTSITYFGYVIPNLSLAHLLTKQDHYLEEAKRWIFRAIQ